MPARSFPVLYVEDPERSSAFYRALGFDPVYRFPDSGVPDYVALARGEDRIGLTRSGAIDELAHGLGAPPSAEIFIYVDDLEAAVSVAREAGAAWIEREPQLMPWGERIAYLRDPDQHRVVLAATPVEPAAGS